MTESKWLRCYDPAPMLGYLRGTLSDRKWRLFLAACCRRVFPLLEDPRSQEAVAMAERFADGTASPEELRRACEAATAACQQAEYRFNLHGVAYTEADVTPEREAALAAKGAAEAAMLAVQHAPVARAYSLCLAAAGAASTAAGAPNNFVEFQAQCALLRDIRGNPFHPVAFDPAWPTPAVSAVARAAYEERDLPSGRLDPVRLAILADAFEEAGCTEASLLSHCRGAGPHVPGCFVLDLLLGRE